MGSQTLTDKIDNIDWIDFNGPSQYDAQKVPLALKWLINLNDRNQANAVGDNLINALGYNHAGEYFPVVLKALDCIIEIANNTDSNVCRICPLATLNNLYYFEPNVAGYEHCSDSELKAFVSKKLLPYSDNPESC